MSCEELEIVWNNIKAEARTLADCEPMLASFYHATLLKHENLGSALSYMLANKLSSPIMPAIAIREVVEEAYAADPEMIANFPAMLPGLAFQTYIRKNIDVKKAPLALQPLCFFSPRCTATGDYAALCDEMLARMEG